MGIQVLPQSTVRTLGSSQVLTDPASLVKELIDNALDANATSIAIEIHSNTIDTIQVRDNGHGVAPEDRPLLARRYCTSKISHSHELQAIGGSSLGFRGEALASVAELSGSLTISTRVESEPVAAALKFNQQGEIAGQERVSLPIGTSVKIADFIKANPVRRQVTLKNAENCLKQIKRTLQAYAFARPHARFSLRVLKAKNNKGDWVYAPKPGGNAEDAAFKVVGAPCASQCIWSVVEDNGFTLQAFLPKPDSTPSKISNIGAFISVDGRPVSIARGTFKQILKLFHEAARKSNPSLGGLKEMFIYLEIGCPRGSYDANVEPAKNDVLFGEANLVTQAAAKLFDAVYPPASITEDQTEHSQSCGVPINLEIPDQEETQNINPERLNMLETAQDIDRPVTETGAEISNNSNDQAVDEEDLPGERRPVFRSNMYGCDEEDLDLLDDRPPTSGTQEDREQLRQARKDVSLSNPFVMAKMNTSVRQQQPDTSLPLAHLPQKATWTGSSPPKQLPRHMHHQDTGLPTPRPSSPLLHVARFLTSTDAPENPSDNAPHSTIPSNLPSLGPYTPMPSNNTHWLGPETPPMQPAPFQHDRNLTVADGGLLSGTPFEATPDTGGTHRSPNKQNRQQNINRPFKPPFVDQPDREKVWFDNAETMQRSQNKRPRQPRPQNHGLVTQGDLGDLVDDPRAITPRRNRDIRDFVGRQAPDSVAAMIESRNHARRRAAPSHDENQIEMGFHMQDIEELMPRQLDFVPASELAALGEQFSPPVKALRQAPKRRRISSRRALQELSTNAPINDDAADEEFRPETARRAPSRRRSSHKLGRSKSAQLPLERVPAGQGMQNIVCPLSISIEKVCHSAYMAGGNASLLGFNEPAHEPQSIFTTSLPDVHNITNSLHDLLITIGSDTDAPSPEALFTQLQGAFLQYRSRAAEEDGVESAS